MEFQKISSPSLRDLFIEQLEHLILSGKVLLFLLPAHLLSNTMGKRLRSGRNHRLHKEFRAGFFF